MSISASDSINGFESLTMNELHELKSDIESRLDELAEEMRPIIETNLAKSYSELVAKVKQIAVCLNEAIPDEYKDKISYKFNEDKQDFGPWLLGIRVNIKGITLYRDGNVTNSSACLFIHVWRSCDTYKMSVSVQNNITIEYRDRFVMTDLSNAKDEDEMRFDSIDLLDDKKCKYIVKELNKLTNQCIRFIMNCKTLAKIYNM